MTLGSNGAIKQAVAVGLGITLLSNHAAGPELASGVLRRVKVVGAPLRRTWFVLQRDGGAELPEAAAFAPYAAPAPPARRCWPRSGRHADRGVAIVGR